ncbi:hypothetical protein ASF05_03170 [Aeromicrobium sp. Leaf245]|nr:hypothetical protein ASF05_03170 [Aeromicrobium sp. Leaf245]
MNYDADAVAESIATHGYFSSEPLIAITNPAEPGTYIVVEGNRRLTALLGLTQAQIRANFPDPGHWDDLSSRAEVRSDDEVPVVVAEDRTSMVPIIGFRHISGILSWKPYAQARYVAKLIDNDGMSVGEVGKMIGIEAGRAGNLYREQAIAKQAADMGIETGPLEEAFSLLTVAMSNTKLRGHVGAPLGSRMKKGQAPIAPEREPELRELLTWVFGDGKTPPLIKDSREVSKLGAVVGNPIGKAAIRDGDSLEVAQQRIDDASLDTHLRLTRRLTTARNALQAAEEDIASHPDSTEVVELLQEVRDAYDALTSAQADEEDGWLKS